MAVSSYEDLIAWKKSIQLVKEIYLLTKRFPDDEKFGLVTQLRRAAVSVPSNIAEGQGRCTTGEFLQFLGHARGSLLEVETQIHIAGTLGYVNHDEQRSLRLQTQELGRVLNGLMNSLK
jgi:four helix bundle protein